MCFVEMIPPMKIFQCINGHSLCEKCKDNKHVKTCPTCRVRFKGRDAISRNILAENLIEAATKKRKNYNDKENLAPEVLRRVKALKNIQFENVEHEVKYNKELNQVDLKYQKLFDKNNERRKMIYLGEYEPTDTECKWWEPNDKFDSKELGALAKKGTVKGIPDFWLTVFQNANNTLLDGMVKQIDRPILKHLQDVTVSLLETNPNFILSFHFSPNEFFSNTVLTKEYILKSDYDEEDPLGFNRGEIITVKGCTIDWKSGKNPGVRIIKRKQKGIAKIVTREEKRDTFFTFFTPPDFSFDDIKYGDDEYEEAVQFLNKDFYIGQNIQEKLIHKAVLYFTRETYIVSSDEEED